MANKKVVSQEITHGSIYIVKEDNIIIYHAFLKNGKVKILVDNKEYKNTTEHLKKRYERGN